MHHAAIPAPPQLTGPNKAKWTRLMRTLDERQDDNGHAYLSPGEAAWMKGWNIRQPGHTMYRHSMPNEDLSDRAQTETD